MLCTSTDGRMPAEFTSTHHVHIIVRRGEMSFSDGKNSFRSHTNDLVIWQMSNTICRVEYTDDFEADFLIVTPEFLLLRREKEHSVDGLLVVVGQRSKDV